MGSGSPRYINHTPRTGFRLTATPLPWIITTQIPWLITTQIPWLITTQIPWLITSIINLNVAIKHRRIIANFALRWRKGIVFETGASYSNQ